tara:strand:+ start:245 stop:415 length:171 start_codon:yes stop_codon:yes gene_type:complete
MSGLQMAQEAASDLPCLANGFTNMEIGIGKQRRMPGNAFEKPLNLIFGKSSGIEIV